MITFQRILGRLGCFILGVVMFVFYYFRSESLYLYGGLALLLAGVMMNIMIFFNDKWKREGK